MATKKSFKSYWLPFLIAFSLGGMFLLTVGYYWTEQVNSINQLIKEDIHNLATILNKINTTAGIISFEHEKNYIDFLNVVKFVGSEVGSMNLKYPEKWEGPYLQDNPTMQEKYYQVVKSGKDYYVVPGLGVRLSSGQMVDLVITIEELLDLGLAEKLTFTNS